MHSLRRAAWTIAWRPVGATARRSRHRRPGWVERRRVERPAPLPRRVRACPGHPDYSCSARNNSSSPGTSPAMTPAPDLMRPNSTLIDPGRPSLAGIKPAIVNTLKADVVTVRAVHAGDACQAVPAGAMCGRDVLVDLV